MPRSVQSASTILPILALPGAYGGLEPLPLRQRGVPLASKRQHVLPVVYVGLGLERWRGGRRTLGGRGGATGLAVFQPLHRRNPERFRAGKRRARALLAPRRGKCVHRGNLFREHENVDRQLHRVAYTSWRWDHCAILSSVINRMRAFCKESTACTCMLRHVMA